MHLSKLSFGFSILTDAFRVLLSIQCFHFGHDNLSSRVNSIIGLERETRWIRVFQEHVRVGEEESNRVA